MSPLLTGDKTAAIQRLGSGCSGLTEATSAPTLLLWQQLLLLCFTNLVVVSSTGT